MSEKPLVELIEEKLSDENISLPVFNRVALKLQRMLGEDDYDGDQLAEVLQQDQAMAAHILKVANSAFYAGLQPVKTVKEAAFRLGAQTLANMIQLIAQKSLYKTRVKQFRPWIDQLWRHALGVAIASKWLAMNLGYSNVAEEAFMAGLLHDIGKLIEIRIIDELLVNQEFKTKLSFNLIKQILADMHCRHGRIYLEKQSMPDIYCMVAARHHEDRVTNENLVLNLVRLADKACHKMGIGLTEAPDILLSTTPEAINLMAKDIVLAELQVSVEEQMASIDKVL